MAHGLSQQELKEIVEEEVLLIRHSGEIPEIALHSSLHYLFEEDDGPGLSPGDIDLTPLKLAVVDRYRRIILRDLNPRNRDKSIYRGLARSIVNWRRLRLFIEREGVGELEPIRQETARALAAFLENEASEVFSGTRASCINCTYEELKEFAEELGLSLDELPEGLSRLCQT